MKYSDTSIFHQYSTMVYERTVTNSTPALDDFNQTISIIIASQHIVYAVAITTSTIIIYCLKNKPLGAQTVLDFMAIDTFYSQIGFLTSWVCIMNLGHFDGQVNYQLAEMLLATGVITLELMIANCQSYIMANAVLIFKPELVNDVPDDRILLITRAFAVTYGLAAKFVDSCKSQNPKALEYMTGKNEKS